ncbi:MAG: hypothetical protein JST01_08235 [Cyanobacteria bacterium SZAS TMP-1]|nr:hypothetical protein [Cyanobacteria bacterium SZAS TMP-1]
MIGTSLDFISVRPLKNVKDRLRPINSGGAASHDAKNQTMRKALAFKHKNAEAGEHKIISGKTTVLFY